MSRRRQWYENATNLSVAAAIHDESTVVREPEPTPADSGTEFYSFSGQRVEIRCERGTWRALLRQGRKVAVYYYASTKPELLDLFGAEDLETKLGRALARLGMVA